MDDPRRRPNLEADQSRPHPQDLGRSASVGIFSQRTVKPTQRGVIYAIASLAARHQPHLGRHRRRTHLAHHRRRQQLEQHHAADSDRHGRRSRSSKPATSIPTPPMPPSTRCGSTTCVRTSIARATAARRGRRLSTAFPTTRTSTRSAKIPSAKDCCSPEPSARFMFRSTTATTGNRCA